ncbi:MAG: FAD-dependent oxidoreductase [Chloroflexota bacterium]|nr:FAD-dependent oxidoreductase [Chloroflexota bacterium]
MSRRQMTRTKYLIIGNSAGGIGAAEGIRGVDDVAPITVVSDEAYPAYSRPLISKYLAKDRDVEGMLFRPVDFYDRHRITAILGKSVAGILPDERVAELEDGRRVAWEKLLVATGGVPIVPGIEGAAKKGVFTFLTLDDAKAIDRFIQSGQRAVVIGGGLIGVSATEALMKRGVEVSIVEMKDRVLNTILDERGSSIAEEAFRKAGVQLICDQTVVEVTGAEAVNGVVLSGGNTLACDMVVVAIGVLPRLDLVRETGVEVNRGVVVDRCMATSHADVYACGDVAEGYDSVYGFNRLTPIWPNAYIGGRTAGRNMAGVHTQYPRVTAVNSLNYFGLDIASAGVVVPPEDSGYQCLTGGSNGSYRKLVIKDGTLQGMICVGDIEKSGMLYGLMRDGTRVDGFEERLLADDLSVASLPRAVWQECLGKSTARPASQREIRPEAVEAYTAGA